MVALMGCILIVTDVSGKRIENGTNLRWVTSQKSEDLIYVAAEA
jgi:hypothetical protein